MLLPQMILRIDSVAKSLCANCLSCEGDIQPDVLFLDVHDTSDFRHSIF